MEIPMSVIAQNVREFLLGVEDLTTTKFKDVRRAVEKRLGLSKHTLDEKKEEMKEIIRDETIKLHQERTQMDSQNALASFPLTMNPDFLDKPPRKPLSAYMIFCQEKRSELKALKPDLVKELGIIWSNLSPKEKAHYENEATNDKIRYENECQNWKLRNPTIPIPKSRGRKLHPLLGEEIGATPTPVANIQGPKKPRSAYIFFCQEHRDHIRSMNPGMAPTDVSKILGNQWNNLPLEEKNKYRELEANDRERYKNELEELGLKPEDLRKTSSHQSNSTSISRTKAAYVFFKNEKQEELRALHPNWSLSDISRELANQWKNLSEEQKKPYAVYVYEDKDKVKKEVEKIKATIKSGPYHSYKRERGCKRARTPYTLFYKEQMKIMREKNKDIAFGDISKVLSNMWKELSQEDKLPYIEQSKEEHNTLLLSDPSYLIKSRKRHLDEPRRPCNSYALFCKAKRQDVKKIHPDITSGDILKELGKIWRETSQEEKDMFEKMAQVEREKYEIEKEKYLTPEFKMKKHETISVPPQPNSMNSHPIPGPLNNNGNNNRNGAPLLDHMNPALFMHPNGLAPINLNPPIPPINQLININTDDKTQLGYSLGTNV